MSHIKQAQSTSEIMPKVAGIYFISAGSSYSRLEWWQDSLITYFHAMQWEESQRIPKVLKGPMNRES